MSSLDEIQQLLKQIKDELPALIQRSQITPVQIVIGEGLSDISKRLGLVQAGEFRAGNGLEPGYGFSGVRMGYPAFAYASNTWHLVGVNNDVLEFGLSADTGKAYFAGGKAILDSDGVTLEAQNGSSYFILWKTDDDQTTVGKIGAFYVGTDAGIEVVGQTKSGYVPVAHLMTANAAGVFLTGIEVRGDGQVQMDLRTATSDGVDSQQIRILANTSLTNSIAHILGIEVNTKGTAANGLGVEIPIRVENGSGILKQIGGLRFRYTDVTNGSEDSVVEAIYMLNGTPTTVQIAP